MNDLEKELKPGQSIELLKELHILTREGRLNQDSRRKLKQVYHLYHFIEPLLQDLSQKKNSFSVVDHGAGKSYLGFILYDLFLKNHSSSFMYGIESRPELIHKSIDLAEKLQFSRMSFLNMSSADSTESAQLPSAIDMVTALHACDSATDDAIDFALRKNSTYVVLIPCCQAEVASVLRKNKSRALSSPTSEIWRHPLHTREFGSHLTNVLRCLRLEAYGYQMTVTEMTGLEHSLKNELILAKKIKNKRPRHGERLKKLLEEFHLQELSLRFNTDL